MERKTWDPAEPCAKSGADWGSDAMTIISSAGTMIEGVRLVRQSGARPVCIEVHAVFAGQAFAALKRSGAADVITTDTVLHFTNRIKIGDELGRTVRKALEGVR